MSYKVYVLAIAVSLICWVPGSLEFTLALHSEGRLFFGRIIDWLLYVPFVLALVMGYYYGRPALVPVSVAGITGALGMAVASLYDIGKVEGGWSLYGSTSYMTVTFTTLFGGSVLACLVGIAIGSFVHR